MDVKQPVGSGFPIKTVRLLGAALFCLGLMILVFGIIDLAWTETQYGTQCITDTYISAWGVDPCGQQQMLWSRIAAPIWASIPMVIAGILGARFSASRRNHHLKNQRSTFGLMSLAVAVLFAPIILIVVILEIVFGHGMYYEVDFNTGSLTRDGIKFGIPVATACLAALGWMVAIASSVFALCFSVQPNEYDVKKGRVNDYVQHQDPRKPPSSAGGHGDFYQGGGVGVYPAQPQSNYGYDDRPGPSTSQPGPYDDYAAGPSTSQPRPYDDYAGERFPVHDDSRYPEGQQRDDRIYPDHEKNDRTYEWRAETANFRDSAPSHASINTLDRPKDFDGGITYFDTYGP